VKDAPSTPGPAWLAVEVAPLVLLTALLLWDVHTLLEPLIVFPLLFFLLWPTRVSTFGRHTILVVTAVFLVWFVATVGSVLVPFALALAIAYLLAPAVEWLVQRKVPRGLAVPLVLLPFLGIVVGLILLVVPALERQVLDLASRLPELGKRLADWLLKLRQQMVSRGGGGIVTDEQVAKLQNLQASDLMGIVSSRWSEVSTHLWVLMLGIGRGFGVGLGLVITLLGYFIVAPIVTAYLLAAWPSFTTHVGDLIPRPSRPALLEFWREYDVMLGRFVRGQLTEATLVAVLTTIGLAVTGFPGAVLIGVIAGLGNLIPTIGLFLSLIPGLLLALAQPEIGTSLIKLIAVFAVVQILDGQVTGPRIVGGAVGLSPVWMMIAVLVFGSLFGLPGMFLAVPMAALVRLLVLRALKRWRASPVYGAETA
jgi:predicted PurR-regulated permease PerM